MNLEIPKNLTQEGQGKKTIPDEKTKEWEKRRKYIETRRVDSPEYAEKLEKMIQIEEKVEGRVELDREEIVFLYEVDSRIPDGSMEEGFQRNFWVKRYRKERNVENDIMNIFECSKDAIAQNKEEINEKTKVYVGELFEGIFQKGIKNIYTSFPEGKIIQTELKVGGKTSDEIRKEVQLEGNAGDLLKEVYTEKPKLEEKEENIRLAMIRVIDLGFHTEFISVEEIIKKAETLGLSLCPIEAAFFLKVRDYRQKLKVIVKAAGGDESNNTNIFVADSEWNASDKQLIHYLAGYPGQSKDAVENSYNDELVFCIRKSLS